MGARPQAVPEVRHQLSQHYEIHGYGGNPVVLTRLAQHGLVSHMTWYPGPPAWRLHYDCALAYSELQALLQDLTARFDIEIFPAR